MGASTSRAAGAVGIDPEEAKRRPPRAAKMYRWVAGNPGRWELEDDSVLPEFINEATRSSEYNWMLQARARRSRSRVASSPAAASARPPATKR